MAQWFHPILVVIKIGWRLVPRCEHVTPGLFRLLIRQEVTAADGGGGAFTLSAAL